MNQRPLFVREYPDVSSDCVEARLCLGAGTDVGNIGIKSLVIETSIDGA